MMPEFLLLSRQGIAPRKITVPKDHVASVGERSRGVVGGLVALQSGQAEFQFIDAVANEF